MVWFGFSFLHKNRGPSLKKGPFKNDAELTLLELKGICWAARSCKNIIRWKIDIFPILKRSFVAILRLVWIAVLKSRTHLVFELAQLLQSHRETEAFTWLCPNLTCQDMSFSKVALA